MTEPTYVTLVWLSHKLPMYYYTYSQNNELVANNTTSIKFLNYLPEKKVVVEQLTSSLTGWELSAVK